MDAINFAVSATAYLTIAVLCLYDALTYWQDQGRKHVNLKGEMTGVGILGTFCGIFLGLLEFDVHDVAGSIPTLLAGLKTAFGTSIAGLFCSTGLNVAQSVKPVAFRKTGDATADTLTRIFQEFEPLMKEVRDATRTNSEQVGAMRTSLEHTMEQLSKGATEEIIKALESVIRDFNQQLQDQFGDNFQRLNEACFKLVEWQENHADTVDQSTTALREASAAFGLLKDQSEKMLEKHRDLLGVLEKVGEDARSFSGAATQLDAAVSSLNNALEKSKDLLGSADAAVAKVQKDLRALEHVKPALEQTAEAAGAAAESARKASEEAGKSVTMTRGELERSHAQLEKALTALTDQFADSYRTYLEGLRRFTDADAAAADTYD